MTINELYPMWYEDRRACVKQSSILRYAQTYKLYLKDDVLASKEISTLRNSDIQRYCNAMFNSGKYARNTCKSAMHLVKSIVDYYYILNDEPVRVYKVRYPSANLDEKKERRTYTLCEKAILTDYCLGKGSKNRMRLGVIIAMYTGLRIGEVCGLKWADIDLAKGKMSVRRTVERITEDGHSSVITQTPKTFSSARTFPLNDDLRQILSARKGNPDFYVLSDKDTPVEPSSLRRSYNRTCKRVGVPVLKFHSMRHAFATELIMSHVDPATVSSLLGHHNASTTLDIYTHTNDKAQFLAVNAGESLLAQV